MSSSGDQDDQAFQTFFVRALYDYEAQDASSLSFIEGDVIEVLTQLPSGWWDGLLGGNRGWFPSNYVVSIDEEEAFGPQMLDLHREEDEDEDDVRLDGSARPTQTGLEPALSLSTSTYPTDGDFSAPLGLSQDFDTLRELMSHDHVGGDAFEQLAEAAMLDSQHGGSNREDPYRNGSAARSKMLTSIDAKRVSDIDLGSLHSAGAESSASSLRSPQSYTRHGSGPVPSSMSVMRTMQSRPRAATGIDLQRGSEMDTYFRDRAASDGTLVKGSHDGKDGDYWVPKVTERGDIMYFNTRTGKETSELPDGAGVSDDDDDDVRMSPIGRTVPAAEGSYFARLLREGKPGLLTSNLNGNEPNRPPPPPSTMVDDEIETTELQKMLEPSEQVPLGQMLHRALECMVQFIDICEETVDSSGLSEADRHFAEDQPALLEQAGLRFGAARDRLISSVRNLMYCSGSLGLSRTDLLAFAELMSQDSGPADRNGKSSMSHAGTNGGTVAAFAGAIVAMHSKSNDAQQQFVAPAGLRGVSQQITAALAKLAVSSRAVTEQAPYVPTVPTTADADQEAVEEAVAAERRHTAKLNSYRQRVNEEAHELALLLEQFGGELGKHRAVDALPPWARRPFGALKSSEGPAGVGIDSLNGGSIAGWRGAGFVLPSAEETAALRLQSMNYFKNPFDLTKEAQQLIVRGKASLKRRPGQALREDFLQNRIVPQLSEVLSLLTKLMGMVRPHLDSTAAAALSSTLGDLALEEVSNGKPRDGHDGTRLDPPIAQQIVAGVTDFEMRFGTFMALFEDIDFASSLDVDGLSPMDADASSARSARDSLQRLVGLKQSCYDSATELVLDAQEISRVISGFSVDSGVTHKMFDTLDVLKQVSSAMVETAIALAKIAIIQGRKASTGGSTPTNNIGARSRIYGVEDAMNNSARLFAGEREGSVTYRSGGSGLPRRLAGRDSERVVAGEDGDEAEMMYLGPGVAVPNGPAGGQPRGAIPTSRDRRGSSATAASSVAGSDLLSRKAGGRWQQGQDEGSVGPDDSSLRSGTSKLKRFFGDEGAPPSQQQPPPAQNEPLPPAPKKVDEAPWYLRPDYAPEDIVISPEGQVKGATLNALVARLTMHNTFDAPFNNTFLLTYRSFTTTQELMNLLFARFRITEPEGLTGEQQAEWVTKKQMPIRLRVFNVLKSWLESYIYEGEDDQHLAEIRDFADEMHQNGMDLPSKQLQRLLDRRAGGEGLAVRKLIMPESAPHPVLPKTRNIKFLDIDALEMARQLTLMDHALYCKIKPVECLGKAWSNPDSDRIAAGIKETISTSNQITGWVAESILVQQDVKKRAAWLKHFIAIADACRSLNNFSTMTAIVSGLNSAPVFRLKRTWDALNQRFAAMLESMNKIMQSSKNFADYREMIHHLNPPCVPFLGVYLTDLTFIEDGNPDRLKSDERLINFGKRQKTAEVIREIMIYQATPYNLSVVPGVQRFIAANLISARNDNELYQQSLKLEPREREDEKISRLLAESGFL